LIRSEAVLGLPGYQLTGIEERNGRVRPSARYTGPIACPHCGGVRLRNKGRRVRRLRHESWGVGHSVLELETWKWQCRQCGRYFWQRLPGILPRKRATEPFRRSVFLKHWDGIPRSRLGQREGIASATVERWFQDFLRLRAAERSGAPWKPISSAWRARPRCRWCAWTCPALIARWCASTSPTPASWLTGSTSSAWSITTSWPAGGIWIQPAARIAAYCASCAALRCGQQAPPPAARAFASGGAGGASGIGSLNHARGLPAGSLRANRAPDHTQTNPCRAKLKGYYQSAASACPH